MPSLELSPLALEDLLQIQEYIALDDPDAAEQVIEQFFSAFEHLAQWPRSGHIRTDLTPRNVLFWPVGSYLIVYQRNEEKPEVQIVAVLHAARDLPAILTDR
ncbi:MAG TPA: type II toxin-antitoxin system RelE/ParE family toxin [Candidatus Acidoferrum sp.]|nr:type II toxin-antitoxin system RelE/ParE family toxin [Candidatus Acidoferrum sp.]